MTAFDVNCPCCGAKKGEPCQPMGMVSAAHVQRVIRAETLEVAAAKVTALRERAL